MENDQLARETEDVSVEVIDVHVNNIMNEMVKHHPDKSYMLAELSQIQMWIVRFQEARK